MPVENRSDPDDPELVVPVEKLMCPLTPAAPAFGVRTITDPLDFVVPAPVDIDTVPPVVEVVRPADMTICPPVPVSAVPTLAVMVPALPPPCALPDATVTDPELPDVVDPV